MALRTKCQTDGANYSTVIKDRSVSVKVSIPFKLDITDEEAQILETNIHNVMEIVLKPYFIDKKEDKKEDDTKVKKLKDFS